MRRGLEAVDSHARPEVEPARQILRDAVHPVRREALRPAELRDARRLGDGILDAGRASDRAPDPESPRGVEVQVADPAAGHPLGRAEEPGAALAHSSHAVSVREADPEVPGPVLAKHRGRRGLHRREARHPTEVLDRVACAHPSGEAVSRRPEGGDPHVPRPVFEQAEDLVGRQAVARRVPARRRPGRHRRAAARSLPAQETELRRDPPVARVVLEHHLSPAPAPVALFLRDVRTEGDEALSVEARDPRALEVVHAHAERARAILEDRPDRGAREPVRLLVPHETAVRDAHRALRAHPDVSAGVLGKSAHDAPAQSVRVRVNAEGRTRRAGFGDVDERPVRARPHRAVRRGEEREHPLLVQIPVPVDDVGRATRSRVGRETGESLERPRPDAPVRVLGERVHAVVRQPVGGGETESGHAGTQPVQPAPRGGPEVPAARREERVHRAVSASGRRARRAPPVRRATSRPRARRRKRPRLVPTWSPRASSSKRMDFGGALGHRQRDERMGRRVRSGIEARETVIRADPEHAHARVENGVHREVRQPVRPAVRPEGRPVETREALARPEPQKAVPVPRDARHLVAREPLRRRVDAQGQLLAARPSGGEHADEDRTGGPHAPRADSRHRAGIVSCRSAPRERRHGARRLAGRRRELQRAAVRADDALRDREAEPRPRGLRRDEELEEVGRSSTGGTPGPQSVDGEAPDVPRRPRRAPSTSRADAPSASTASSAFATRLSTTCLTRAGSRRAGRRPRAARTRAGCAGVSASGARNATASPAGSLRSAGTVTEGRRPRVREEVREEAREPARLDARGLREVGRGDTRRPPRPSSRASFSSRSSRLSPIAFSGFRISCARPAATSPSSARRSASTRAASDAPRAPVRGG